MLLASRSMQKVNALATEGKKAAPKHLMFLKEKRWGKTKGRGCADGWKQRLHKTKEETSLPTVSLEALILTCMIDAKEGQNVTTCDTPGAFMRVDVDEKIHLKLEGDIACSLSGWISRAKSSQCMREESRSHTLNFRRRHAACRRQLSCFGRICPDS